MLELRTLTLSLSLAASAGIAMALTAPLRAQDAGVRSAPYIAVQGEAKSKAKPDVAKLTVTAQTRAPTLDAAVRDHAPRAAKAAEALAGLKAKGATVAQSGFTAMVEQPRPTPPEDGRIREKPAPVAVATTRFDVEVSPVDTVGDVVDALAATGVLEVRSVSYALSDPKTEANKARALAMLDAIEQAQVYAEAGKFRLVEIVAVQDGQARTYSNEQADLPMRAMSPAAAPAQMRSAPPATIDTDASVNVTWRIDGGTRR